MKLCKDCRWFNRVQGRSTVYDSCSGPHLAPSVVDGERYMTLPAARFSGRQGLGLRAERCGEEGRHWTPIPKIERVVARAWWRRWL